MDMILALEMLPFHWCDVENSNLVLVIFSTFYCKYMRIDSNSHKARI